MSLFQRLSYVPVMYVVRAVVCYDQAVLLHGAKNFLHVRIAGALRHVDVRLQSQPRQYFFNLT